MITAIVILSIVVIVLIVVIAYLYSTVDELQDNLIETHETVCKVNGELHNLLDLDINTLTDRTVYRSRYVFEKRSPYDKTPEFIRGIREILNEQYRLQARIPIIRYDETWHKNGSDEKEEINNATK